MTSHLTLGGLCATRSRAGPELKYDNVENLRLAGTSVATDGTERCECGGPTLMGNGIDCVAGARGTGIWTGCVS